MDPSFGQAFQVTDPTPRYAHILAAVPSLAVAPLPRLLRAVLTLGSELERCFERRGLPLPPWRSSDALASRYEQAAHSGAGGAATPAAAAATGIAAKQRQQAVKQAQQLERVQLRLLKLGLQPAGDGGDAVAPASPPSPLSDAGAGADSPTSVVQVGIVECRRLSLPPLQWPLLLLSFCFCTVSAQCASAVPYALGTTKARPPCLTVPAHSPFPLAGCSGPPVPRLRPQRQSARVGLLWLAVSAGQQRVATTAPAAACGVCRVRPPPARWSAKWAGPQRTPPSLRPFDMAKPQPLALTCILL